MFDSRSFGRNTYAGNHLLKIKPYIVHPISKHLRDQIMQGLFAKSIECFNSKEMSSLLFNCSEVEKKLILPEEKERSDLKLARSEKRKTFFKRIFSRNKEEKKKSKIYEEENYKIEIIEEEHDWWMKYYASHEEDPDKVFISNKLTSH